MREHSCARDGRSARSPKEPTEAFVRAPGSPVRCRAGPRTLRPEEVPSPSPLNAPSTAARAAPPPVARLVAIDAKKAEATVRYDKENASRPPARRRRRGVARRATAHCTRRRRVRALAGPHRDDTVAPRRAGRAAEYGGGSLAATIGPLISPSALISLVAMEGTAMEGTAAAEGDGETAVSDENLSPEGEHPDARGPRSRLPSMCAHSRSCPPPLTPRRRRPPPPVRRRPRWATRWARRATLRRTSSSTPTTMRPPRATRRSSRRRRSRRSARRCRRRPRAPRRL